MTEVQLGFRLLAVITGGTHEMFSVQSYLVVFFFERHVEVLSELFWDVPSHT